MFATLALVPETERPACVRRFSQDLLELQRFPCMQKLAKVLDGTFKRQFPDWPAMDGGFPAKLRMQLSYNKEHNVYALVVNGNSESDMVRLTREHKFPRGCIIFWVPKTFITIRGFFPKFQNDGESNLSGTNWKNIDKLYINEKFSGFLIQVAGVMINDKPLTFVFSKQSCEGEFVERGKELFGKYLTLELAKTVAEHDLYLGLEGLHTKDRSHGYVAKRDGCVVTCISQGAMARFDVDFDVCSNSSLVNMSGSLVMYRQPPHVVNFCRKTGLPHGMVVTIHSQHYPGGDVMSFVNTLIEDRDTMHHEKFMSRLKHLWQSFPNVVEIIPGNVDHIEVVGDVFEGLVMSAVHLAREPGQESNQHAMTKVKFTPYTWITMCLRDMCQKKMGADAGTATHIKRFTKFWCHSPDAVHYYTVMSKAACVYHLKNPSTAEDAHSVLAKVITTLDKDAVLDLAREFDEKTARKAKGTVIFCVGPIGAGKTTFSNYLCSKYMSVDGGVCYKCIDGDNLCPNTSQLGPERSECTFAALCRALLEGKVAVIHLGGGALASIKNLRDKVSAIFDAEICFITCVVGRASTSSRDIVEVDPNTYDPSQDYEGFDRPFYVKLVEQRKARGVWDSKTNVDAIYKQSMTNRMFAETLLRMSDYAYSVCRVEYPLPDELATGLDILTKRVCPSEPMIGQFMQVRVVVLRTGDPLTTARHITLSFVPSRQPVSAPDLARITQEFMDLFPSGKIPATLFKFTGTLMNAAAKKPKQVELAVAFVEPERKPETVYHITEFHGSFKPVDMHMAHLAYVNNKQSGLPLKFELTCNNQQKPGDTETYTFAYKSHETVEYMLLDVIAI